jgi:O-antigen/teichoic acid export membrane protein
MDKAVEVGQRSAHGSFQLFIGQILSTILLAVGTIVLQLVIPEKEYGLYTIALIPATTILLFQDWGIGSAIIKNCAKYRAENNLAGARQVIISGLTFEVAAGIIFSLLALLTAGSVASMINRPEASYLIAIASLFILSTSLYASSYSAFIGFERMDLYVVALICHGLIQCVVAPLLVYAGYGALGALLGYILGYMVAGGLSMGLLYFVILKKIQAPKISLLTIKTTLKPMLSFGVPLAIGTILAGLLTQFYSFMMAKYVLDAAVIGNYRTAINFADVLTFFSMPISTVLFPAFSKINPQKEKETLQKVFKSSVKYTAFLIVPVTILLMVIATPLTAAIYGDKWLLAPTFLTLYVLVNVFTVFGNIAAYGLLTAVGETKFMMKIYAFSLLIGVPLGVFIIPPFGIPGLIVVTMISGLPSMFIAIHRVARRYGAKVDFTASAKILLSAIAAGLITYLLLQSLQTFAVVELFGGVALFTLIYLTASPLVGAINSVDIANYQAIVSNMGFLAAVLKFPLKFVEAVLVKKSSLINRALILKDRLS